MTIKILLWVGSINSCWALMTFRKYVKKRYSYRAGENQIIVVSINRGGQWLKDNYFWRRETVVDSKIYCLKEKNLGDSWDNHD